MKTVLKETSKWLLLFLQERHPSGFSINQRLPYSVNNIPQPLGIDMRTFRGLEKRGLAKMGNHSLIYITDTGLKYLDEISNKIL